MATDLWFGLSQLGVDVTVFECSLLLLFFRFEWCRCDEWCRFRFFRFDFDVSRLLLVVFGSNTLLLVAVFLSIDCCWCWELILFIAGHVNLGSLASEFALYIDLLGFTVLKYLVLALVAEPYCSSGSLYRFINLFSGFSWSCLELASSVSSTILPIKHRRIK